MRWGSPSLPSDTAHKEPKRGGVAGSRGACRSRPIAGQRAQVRHALARMMVWSGLWGGVGESGARVWSQHGLVLLGHRPSPQTMHTSKVGMMLEVMILSRHPDAKGFVHVHAELGWTCRCRCRSRCRHARERKSRPCARSPSASSAVHDLGEHDLEGVEPA